MKEANLGRVLMMIFAMSSVIQPVMAESKMVYFGTGGPGAKGIYRASFDPVTGRITPSTLAAEIGAPGFLALHPSGARLYAVASWEKQSGVAGYKMTPSGDLELFTQKINPDGGGAHVAVHPSGKFLLTAQYGGGSTALFPLDGEGNLGEPQIFEHEGGSNVDPKRQSSPHPHYCGFSPDGKYALVPDLGLDQIVIYQIDLAKPTLTRHGVAQSVPGGGPRHMKFSPDGKYIYLLNELSLSITTFAWDAAAGTTQNLSTTPTLSEEAKAAENFNSAAEILVHSSGKYIYSSNRGHDTVTVCQADQSTGKLEVIQVQPIRGAFPRNINLDPTGNYLLAAGADSNTVAVHRIIPETGKLNYQKGAIINVPAPICILFAR
jgi:6-phosphogluconolactonase